MFFRFSEHCSNQFLPSPYGAKHVGAPSDEPFIDSLAEEAIILEIKKDQPRIQMRRLEPLIGADSVSISDCDREVANLAAVLQNHHHYGCGDDLTCSRSLPRPKVDETHFVEDSQLLAVRRTGTMLTGYIYPLMLAAPSNHAVWLNYDASQYLRQLEQWQLLHDLGLTTVRAFILLLQTFKNHIQSFILLPPRSSRNLSLPAVKRRPTTLRSTGTSTATRTTAWASQTPVSKRPNHSLPTVTVARSSWQR